MIWRFSLHASISYRTLPSLWHRASNPIIKPRLCVITEITVEKLYTGFDYTCSCFSERPVGRVHCTHALTLQFFSRKSKRGNDTVPVGLSLPGTVLVRTYESLFFFRPRKIIILMCRCCLFRTLLLLLLFISYSGLDERCEAHGWVLQDI